MTRAVLCVVALLPAGLAAQRLTPPFPTVTYDLSSLPTAGGARAESGCGVSSNLGVRLAVGAVAGAGAGFLLYELYAWSANLLSDGSDGPPQSHRDRPCFILGVALVGAAWEGFGAPLVCPGRRAPLGRSP